jgi:uridine phosphorylase
MPFPNLKNKHAEDAMFSPKEFIAYAKKQGKYKFRVPERVILCYEKSLLKHILENHSVTKINSSYGDTYLINETRGKILIIGNFGIGAPIATIVLEEFIELGAKKFISIGTAGTLQKGVKIGDFMVCEKAIRDDGVSYHYLKSSKYAHASKELTKNIINSMEKLKQKYIVGTSWTIDAPYRETVAEARQYQKEGITTVEMEASALFAVAKYRNVELGAIFTISDSLAELEWKAKFHLKKTKKGLETLYKVAVDALLNY